VNMDSATPAPGESHLWRRTILIFYGALCGSCVKGREFDSSPAISGAHDALRG
jgi:hypothetical protein